MDKLDTRIELIKANKQQKSLKRKKTQDTIINFVLDESGSMSSCLLKTIDGFNAYINSLKTNSKTFLTLTKFEGNNVKIVHNVENIKNVPELTVQTYVPGGGTPLFDAIGKTIKATQEELNKRKNPANVLCVIMTDGEENQSIEFKLETIKKLIKLKTDEGWTFVFLGADQDAWTTGQSIGLAVGNTWSYGSNQTSQTFETLANRTSNYVRTASNSTGAYATTDFFGKETTDNNTYETKDILTAVHDPYSSLLSKTTSLKKNKQSLKND